jgi:hypothetical protein
MNRFTLSRRHQTETKRPARARPVLELLEERTVLSNYTAANVADLIADINAANLAGGSNTIAMVAGNTFTLAAVNNTTDGGNGLPIVVAGDNLTIVGNGDTIARSTATGTPGFRLFEVAAGASLALANVTVQGGAVYGSGGGIYSSGSLTLTNVTLSSNSARGFDAYWDPTIPPYGGYAGPGGDAYGGGLYVAGGTATLTNTILSSNSATGGGGGQGGWAYGGGMYVAGGTVSLTNTTLVSNSATGGWGGGHSNYVGQSGAGGGAWGGGLCVGGGMVTLTNDTLSSNSAEGGDGYGNGNRYTGGADGGGLFICSAATVYLDTYTLKHTKNNKPGDIYGSYTLIT